MANLARRQTSSDLANYSVLLKCVRETFVSGMQKAEEIKVQTYWEGGRLIHEHLGHHQDKAGYGAQVMEKLARSLGVGDRLLYRMVRFYEAFPDRPILSTWTKLTWSHYRALAGIPDQKKRLQIENIAAKEEWDVRKLEKHISLIADTAPATAHGGAIPQLRESRIPLLEFKRRKPGIYHIVVDGDGCAVDLGFTSYQALDAEIRNPKSEIRNELKPDDLVRLSATGKPVPAKDVTKADLYTYNAEILKVVDGDTLWLKIWLKQSHWLKEKVRLRGIDCPEMDTPEGIAAKRFVEGLVKKAVSVTITTTKPDKWDRYLSDIFLRQEDGEELFLNNLLLENGHARRYDKVTPADWEE